MQDQERRSGDKEMLEALARLDLKLDNTRKEIVDKFDYHKDNICVPTRIRFAKDIEGLKIKSGFFGTLGGLIVLGFNYLVRRF
jgi:hypothetical protein